MENRPDQGTVIFIHETLSLPFQKMKGNRPAFSELWAFREAGFYPIGEKWHATNLKPLA
jgi:hypothetical protein